MARNNPKPLDKIEWIPDDATNISPPSAGRKLVGWLFNIKPPAEIFNWKWNKDSRNEDYSFAQVEDWIVIDSDPDEGDYATLAAYIADAPALGDRILIKEDQTTTVQINIPPEITLRFLDNTSITCSTDIATSIVKFGSSTIIEGVLNLFLLQTGTTAKAIEFDGNNVVGRINIRNKSTGTLTTGYHINATRGGMRIGGFINNTGGGTFTNNVIDNSNEVSNIIDIVDFPNQSISRSDGAKYFQDGLKYDLGSDADGDIYYRDDGVLKRLPKGTDEDVLRLKSGLPSWVSEPLTTIIDIGTWDMNTSPSSTPVAHGLTWTNIRSVSAFLRDDSGSEQTDFNRFNFSESSQHAISVSTTQITLQRGTGGAFDGVNWQSTAFNRGYIVISHIP